MIQRRRKVQLNDLEEAQEGLEILRIKSNRTILERIPSLFEEMNMGIDISGGMFVGAHMMILSLMRTMKRVDFMDWVEEQAWTSTLLV